MKCLGIGNNSLHYIHINSIQYKKQKIGIGINDDKKG